ncbi:helix-turn-helix domain-containing protein [Streptomyces sp. NPDC001478]
MKFPPSPCDQAGGATGSPMALETVQRGTWRAPQFTLGASPIRIPRHYQAADHSHPFPVPTDPLQGSQPMSALHQPRHEASFFNLQQTAKYLGISPNTLYVWRHRRQGPPSFRMGRRVMYRVSALDKWVRDQERSDARSNATLNPLAQTPQRRTRV